MSRAPVDGNEWIRRFHHSATARVQLFCFPHAGGSASFYFPLSRALQPMAEVQAIQYPGRQDRRNEASIDNIGTLADELVNVLQPRISRPPVFFGHSMGAIVAFEVALRMERNLGMRAARLIASGRRAPSRQRDEKVHQHDDEGLIAEIRKLSGTHRELLEDDETLRLILPTIRSDYRAIETYSCPPDGIVSCPVTVFVGDSDPHVTLDEARAWQQHTLAGFQMRVFPGGHFYLAQQTAEVTAALRDALGHRPEDDSSSCGHSHHDRC